MLRLWDYARSTIQTVPADVYVYATGGIVMLAVLSFTNVSNYPFLHGAAGLIGIVIMLLTFAITLNVRNSLGNNYLLFVGISIFFVACLNLLHFLFYFYGVIGARSGDTEVNVAAQLWIAARYLQAGSLLAAPLFINRRLKVRALMGIYAAITLFVLLSIVYWHTFPIASLSGGAQTLFRQTSEFVIPALFLLSLALLMEKQAIFKKHIFYLLSSYITITIVSEIFSLWYTGVHSSFNLLGNFLEVVALYLLYQAFVVTSFRDPYRMLLGSLQQKEDDLRATLAHAERTVDELKASEQKFRSVAESMKSALVTVDDTGRIIFWNKSAEHTFGYRGKEIIGKSFSLLGLGNHTLPDVLSLPKITAQPLEMSGRKKSGETFPLEIASSSWKLGREQFYTSIIKDITEQKEFEHKTNEYAKRMAEGKARDDALLLSIADGILVTDTSGKIIYVNKALENLCGRDAAEILHRDLDEAIPFFDDRGWRVPKEDRPIYRAIHAGASHGSPISTTATFYLEHAHDRRKIPLSISAAPFVVGNDVLGAVAAWRDITREKEIDKAKSEFISFASHQLRTPLTSISLCIDMLLNHIDDALTKEQKKYLKIAFNGVKDMADIIETLLNISRIQMGTLVVNPEPVSLAKLADAVLQEVSIPLKDRDIKIKKIYDTNVPAIEIDQRLMKIVLENLISNAIKYSPAHGTVLVEIKKEGTDVLVAISDTGDGIPEDQQEKIFEKLFRVQNNSKVKGTGLGLYIVKAAVDQYGGRVWCTSPSSRAFDEPSSSNRRGSTFSVTVPFAGMAIRKELVGGSATTPSQPHTRRSSH